MHEAATPTFLLREPQDYDRALSHLTHRTSDESHQHYYEDLVVRTGCPTSTIGKVALVTLDLAPPSE
jgi:hypothetical protein